MVAPMRLSAAMFCVFLFSVPWVAGAAAQEIAGTQAVFVNGVRDRGNGSIENGVTVIRGVAETGTARADRLAWRRLRASARAMPSDDLPRTDFLSKSYENHPTRLPEQSLPADVLPRSVLPRSRLMKSRLTASRPNQGATPGSKLLKSTLPNSRFGRN